MRSRRRLGPPPYGEQGDARVLIISASMGAGHDGAARTLAEQLRAGGHVVEVRDFLKSGPLRIGSALRRGYEFELKHVPSAYDATYRFWYRVPWLCPVVAWLVTVLTRRRVRRWVARLDPHVVVSTYPLTTLCLGRLRRTGRLAVPVINFITDFGVHPLWVHRGVDLNLAIHDTPAADAARLTSRPAVACGPAVSERFAPDRLPSRSAARARFGLTADQRAVLVVAGSWGVGNVAETWSAIAHSGRFVPVVVCGRDERLRRHVDALAAASATPSIVVGWTDEMPALMVACDALVENAGGLTSLEAMRAGLPVVSFDPIAGHGKENTAAMDAAGVGRLAGDARALEEALAAVTVDGPARDQQLARATALFKQAPADLVVATAGRPVAVPLRPRASRALRVAVAGLLTGALGWLGLTTGVAVATEAGAGVAHPTRGSGAVVYLGIKLSAAELQDQTVQQEMRQMKATVVVDEVTAQAAPDAVRLLVADGITVANGGAGEPPTTPGADSDFPWRRAAADSRAGDRISQLIDSPITASVPGRRLDAWDLMESRSAHLALIVPNHILHTDQPLTTPMRLVPHEIYLINGMHSTAEALASYLSRVETSLGVDQLASVPLASLG